jgi:hypothetical protein
MLEMKLIIRPTHEGADAFWKAWKEFGETHKHGYYESTWTSINQAISASGLYVWDGYSGYEFDFQNPRVDKKDDGYLLTKINGSARYLTFIESIAYSLFGFYPKDIKE